MPNTHTNNFAAIFTLIATIFIGIPQASSQTKPLPSSAVVFRIDVLKNGKKIKTEQITVAGIRETYENIRRVVQIKGPIDVAEWKLQANNMTAVTRCGFLLETFAAIQGIKEGKLDSTPAIELTANNIVIALSEVNEVTNVACEKSQ